MVTVAMSLIDRLAEESGAKVEIDFEGSIVVTPASNPHVVAVGQLFRQLASAAPPSLFVLAEGPRWSPTGGEFPSYVPDLSVVDPASLRGAEGFMLRPAPLLVVEVISSESRRRDLGEKAEAYFLGGADSYWTVDLPANGQVAEPTLTVRTRETQAWAGTEMTGIVELAVPFAVRLDLGMLAL